VIDRRCGLARLASALVLLAILSACGPRTKEDLIERTRGVETRVELEKAAGKPNDIAKMGPVETWTYRASNGDVIFLIIGDKVTLQAAGGGERRSR
jgi:hypothetical protein